jgi:hypothetical protein
MSINDKPVFKGRSVYYIHPAHGAELLATVVYVYDNGTVNLEVHPDGVNVLGQPFIMLKVPYDDQHLRGTWHHLPSF